MDAIALAPYLFLKESVSIHAPVMDAMISFLASSTIVLVSIHAPVMDAITDINTSMRVLWFQSTRP